jgi:hypothetical protein
MNKSRLYNALFLIISLFHLSRFAFANLSSFQVQIHTIVQLHLSLGVSATPRERPVPETH